MSDLDTKAASMPMLARALIEVQFTSMYTMSAAKLLSQILRPGRRTLTGRIRDTVAACRNRIRTSSSLSKLYGDFLSAGRRCNTGD
jgi:hypothetical protein